MKSNKVISIIALVMAASVTTGLFLAQTYGRPQGTVGASRFLSMNESASFHPFTTIASSPSYDRSVYLNLAPLLLQYEGVYASICKAYLIRMADNDLAGVLGLGTGNDSANPGLLLYCENGTARVFYGSQLNALSVIDYVFRVNGSWYMAWFAISYNNQMLDMLGHIARG